MSKSYKNHHLNPILPIAGYSLIASDLKGLLDNVYPYKSTLSQALVQTLGFDNDWQIQSKRPS